MMQNAVHYPCKINITKQLLSCVINLDRHRLQLCLSDHLNSQTCPDFVEIWQYLIYIQFNLGFHPRHHSLICHISKEIAEKCHPILQSVLKQACQTFGARSMFYFQNTCLEEAAYGCIAENMYDLRDLPKEKYDPEKARKIIAACRTLHENLTVSSKDYRRLASKTGHKITASDLCHGLSISKSVENGYIPLIVYKWMRNSGPNNETRFFEDVIFVSTWTSFLKYDSPSERKLIMTDMDLSTKNVFIWNIAAKTFSWTAKRLNGYDDYIFYLLRKYGHRLSYTHIVSLEKSRVSNGLRQIGSDDTKLETRPAL